MKPSSYAQDKPRLASDKRILREAAMSLSERLPLVQLHSLLIRSQISDPSVTRLFRLNDEVLLFGVPPLGTTLLCLVLLALSIKCLHHFL